MFSPWCVVLCVVYGFLLIGQRKIQMVSYREACSQSTTTESLTEQFLSLITHIRLLHFEQMANHLALESHLCSPLPIGPPFLQRQPTTNVPVWRTIRGKCVIGSNDAMSSLLRAVRQRSAPIWRRAGFLRRWLLLCCSAAEPCRAASAWLSFPPMIPASPQTPVVEDND